MPTSYTYLRYLTYGAFIVCNAIIASIAVWGLSVAQAAQISVPTEPYLIFVGSFGLVVIFSIIFIELLRRNAITSRVWFECAWTGLFLFLELVGASLITNVSFSFCEIKDVRSVTMGCSSEIKVLEAFSWICTAILLCYFFTLVISSCINHYHNGSFIWNSNIRHFPPLENIWNLGSFRCHSPSTPILERSFTPASIIAPKPRHPTSAPNLMATYHSGLSQYEIEHYQPPVSPISSPYASGQGPTSLYPQYLRSSLLSRPPATYNPQADSPIEPSPTSVAPPPLGIWPRADIIQQSSHSKRQSSRPRPVGPSGPRTRDRMGSEDLRPAPLDLSKISALNRR